MLMNASSQRGMKMVIISTTGYLQRGILKMAYLKGLKSSWVGRLSQKTLLFLFPFSYQSISILITSLQSKVYASILVSTISYFPKLSKVEHESIGASALIFYCKGKLLFRIGSSILRLLKLMRLIYNLSPASNFSSTFLMYLLISSLYLYCLSLLTLSSQSKRSTSMWSNETVRSRLMKLKGAKNSLNAELLMISILNSFFMI